MKLGNASVSLGNDQHMGDRSRQEDYFAIHLNEDENEDVLLVVADGMGGHVGGEVASVIALNAFVDAFKKRNETANPKEVLANCLRAANEAVLNDSKSDDAHSGMGTTLVAAWVTPQGFMWLSVGDSPVFLCRGGGATRINRDHTVGAMLDRDLAAGRISVDDARRRRTERDYLVSYVGMKDLAEVDISDRQPLQPGDTLVLASDGLTAALSTTEIGAASGASEKDAQKLCKTLVSRAIGKKISGQDNISVVALTLLDPDADSVQNIKKRKGLKRKKPYILFLSLILLLFVFSVGVCFMVIQDAEISDESEAGSVENRQDSEEGRTGDNGKEDDGLIRKLNDIQIDGNNELTD